MDSVIIETNISKRIMTIEYRFLISDLNLHLPVLESIYCNLFFQGNALNYLLLSLRNFPLFKLKKQKCQNNCETIQRKNVSFWQVDFSLPWRDQRKSADERKTHEAFGTENNIQSSQDPTWFGLFWLSHFIFYNFSQATVDIRQFLKHTDIALTSEPLLSSLHGMYFPNILASLFSFFTRVSAQILPSQKGLSWPTHLK